jgi:hypothetical protein
MSNTKDTSKPLEKPAPGQGSSTGGGATGSPATPVGPDTGGKGGIKPLDDDRPPQT